MSISRAQKIAASLRSQFGYATELSVPIGLVGSVDVLATLGGEPVHIVFCGPVQPSELTTLQSVAGVSVVLDGIEIGEPQHPKTGRGRWLYAFKECLSLSEWAKHPRCVVPEKSLRRRIEQDWAAEDAISQPARKASKPAKKPYPEFPLSMHSSGQWCKKIAGKLYYFGAVPWKDALERFQKEHDSIRLGRRVINSPTVADLTNDFLRAKESALNSHELGQRTFNDYHSACARLVEYLGKDTTLASLSPQRFSDLRNHLGDGVSIVTLGNRVRMSRVIFKHAYDSRMIEKSIDMANYFELPPAKATRRQRWEKQQEHGLRMFDADDITSLLEVAGTPLKAMILLGINCGLGNTDCSELTIQSVNMQKQWLSFPRPKTMVMRECPLWPETMEAIQETINSRPKPRHDELRNRLFLTKSGRAWVKVTKNGANDDGIAKEFSKLLQLLLMKRHGLNFYALRHTFQTVGEAAGDPVVVRFIMGHVDSSMSARYREHVSEERLRAVVEFVREQLLGEIEEIELPS